MASQRLDDQDPSVVYAGPGWSTNPYAPMSFNNTLSSTTSTGANAQLVFKGIAIEVYGFLDQNGIPPTSTYTIDGGALFTYNGELQAATNQSQVLFYASGQLSPGRHTLLITNVNEGGLLSLDSFLLTPLPKNTIDAGAIVGAVLGSLAFILFSVLAIIYWRQVKGSSGSGRRGVKVRPGSPDVEGDFDAEKPLPSTAAWPVVTPFDLNPRRHRSRRANPDRSPANHSLLNTNNQSGDSLTLASTTSLGKSLSRHPRSRSSSPPPPLPTAATLPPTPSRTSTTTPPPAQTPPPSALSSLSLPLHPLPPQPPLHLNGGDVNNNSNNADDDNAELADYPPPRYSGSGFQPVRKSMAGMYALGGTPNRTSAPVTPTPAPSATPNVNAQNYNNT